MGELTRHSSSNSFLSSDALTTARPDFDGYLPDEILLQNAHHVVEWCGIPTLNESRMLPPQVQRRLAIANGLPNRFHDRVQLIKESAHRTISSTLFAFRLVCRAWHRVGTEVFLECLDSPRYAHYSTVHLPPRGGWSVSELATMLAQSGNIRSAATTLKYHVLPENWAGLEDRPELLALLPIPPADREVLNRDFERMFRKRVDDLALFSNAIAIDSSALLKLMSALPKLRRFDLVYREFWRFKGKDRVGPRHFGLDLSGMVPNQFLMQVLLATSHAQRELRHLQLLLISEMFLQKLDDKATSLYAARLRSIETLVISFAWHPMAWPDDRAPLHAYGLLSLAQHTQNLKHVQIYQATRQWWDGYRRLTWLDLWVRGPPVWPVLRSLEIGQSRVHVEHIISFLHSCRVTIQKVVLQDIHLSEIGPDPNGWPPWPRLINFMRLLLDLTEVEIDPQVAYILPRLGLSSSLTGWDDFMVLLAGLPRADRSPFRRQAPEILAKWVLRQAPLELED